MRSIEIVPSVLPADFSRLGEQCADLTTAGVDRIHWDVMDGNFVPNLTFGPDVIASCRPHTDIRFEAHLMVTDPDLLAGRYIDAGCDLLILHAESGPHLHRSLDNVTKLGAQAAVTINPSTPLSAIEHVLDMVEMVLIMTVNPGFGGQRYIASMESKVSELKTMIDTRGLDVDIEVDGGIGPATIEAAAGAGANVFVSGSALFNYPSLSEGVDDLRRLASSAHQAGIAS